ncbi:hypothetical protein [Streptomyces yerevanensis]|uniref:hypothetical protein n=1 Tax=Streptomyces yerevanensis TaxID=66378 RepID=UPI0012FE8CA0|nr:hypothetical protein [Streptomyces yerevanensis]
MNVTMTARDVWNHLVVAGMWSRRRIVGEAVLALVLALAAMLSMQGDDVLWMVAVAVAAAEPAPASTWSWLAFKADASTGPWTPCVPCSICHPTCASQASTYAALGSFTFCAGGSATPWSDGQPSTR